MKKIIKKKHVKKQIVEIHIYVHQVPSGSGGGGGSPPYNPPYTITSQI